MTTLPELSFDWSQPYGELPEDSMGRADHARNLTQFLIKKGQETSYVLNLNAKWGTGKTYFLRRWVAEIEKIYPTVYIDAWGSDHSGDPLLSVVSGIKSKLHELSDVSEFEAKLFEGVAKTVKAAAPAVVRALIKGQLKRAGINIDDLGDAFSNDDAADAGAKLVEQAINAHEEASVGVDNIKASIQGWLESVVRKGERQYPLFIFIDELDRCRPTYAIETLETIKHIFDLKNVVFVVATDKDQLQHSIRAIYGAEFDSRLYLDRFFTRTVTLSNPSRADFIAQKLIDSDTFSTFAEQDENFVYMASDEGREADLRKLLTGIADGFNWPLRTVSLWLDRLEAALIISHRKLDIILLSFMMALETDDSDWLRKYQDNVPIFRNGINDGAGGIKFKSFIITTRWSLSQHKEYLLKIGFHNMSHIMESEHDAEVDLLHFVLNRLSMSVNSDSDYYMSIRSAFKKAISGEGIDKHLFASDNDSPPYHSVALDFHSYFHEMSGTNIDHYYDICRYSSLMS